MTYLFKGEKYDSSLTRKEIANLIRADIKKVFSNVIVSVTTYTVTRKGWGVLVTIKDLGFNPFTQDYVNYLKDNVSSSKLFEIDRYNSEAKNVVSECENIIKQYKHIERTSSIGDSYSNFYSDVTIGLNNKLKSYFEKDNSSFMDETEPAFIKQLLGFKRLLEAV